MFTFCRHTLALALAASFTYACGRAPAGNSGGNAAVDNAGGKAMNSNDRRDAGGAAHATPQGRETPAGAPSADAAQTNGDLDFEAGIGAAGRDQLRIKYTVKNRGRAPVLLINRPPAAPNADPAAPPNTDFVYVETERGGALVISKRIREQPRDRTVFVPETPGATMLAPGETFEESVSVDLAARRAAAAGGAAANRIPDPVRRVRFCLGVVPAEGLTTRSVGAGRNQVHYPDPGAALLKQRLLCSTTVELRDE